MSSTTDIWFAFARTFSVLFVVLALLVLVFWMIKRFTGAGGNPDSRQYINVLGMHHFSPKEKLVLVDVLGKTVLIGITPNRISRLTTIETDQDFSFEGIKPKPKFANFLAQKLGNAIPAAGKRQESGKERS